MKKKWVLLFVVFLVIVLVVLLGIKFINFDNFPLDMKLIGEKEVRINLNEEYNDEKFTSKLFFKDISDKVKMESNVDTSKPGNYSVTYSYIGKIFKKTLERKVVVVDNIPPELTLEKDHLDNCLSQINNIISEEKDETKENSCIKEQKENENDTNKKEKEQKENENDSQKEKEKEIKNDSDVESNEEDNDEKGEEKEIENEESEGESQEKEDELKMDFRERHENMQKWAIEDDWDISDFSNKIKGLRKKEKNKWIGLV